MLQPFAHPVACCFVLLGLAAQSMKPSNFWVNKSQHFFFVQWSSKHRATMLDPFAQLFQHCWGHTRALHMVYKDLWAVSFPWCTAGPNIVESCCIRLHSTGNTDAATPNIVGPTMLGVVVSVCTPLATRMQQLLTLLAQQCWELLSSFARSLRRTLMLVTFGTLKKKLLREK